MRWQDSRISRLSPLQGSVPLARKAVDSRTSYCLLVWLFKVAASSQTFLSARASRWKVQGFSGGLFYLEELGG